MAQKKTGTTEKTKVRRIKAKDDAPKKVVKKTAEKASKPKEVVAKKAVAKEPAVKHAKTAHDFNEPTKNPLVALSNYFKGAWYELKQVRWPNRSATWGMTIAVLLFSAFFVVLILALDTAFGSLFEAILKK